MVTDLSISLHSTWYNSSCNVSMDSSWTINGNVANRDIKSPLIVNQPDKFGFMPLSPYSRELVKHIPPTLSFKEGVNTPNKCGQHGVETLVSGSVGTGEWTSWGAKALPKNEKNKYLTRSLNDLKDQRIQLAMTLYFTGQTASMIAKRATDAANVLRMLRRGDTAKGVEYLRQQAKRYRGNTEIAKLNRRRQLAKFGNKAGGVYLEVLFGWLQLARDIQGAYEELVTKANKPRFSLVTGRSGSQIDFSETKHAVSKHKAGFYPICELNGSINGSHGHRAVSIGRIEAEATARISELGLLNPFELLWDIIPWSWVIDQGIGIAASLGTIDATAGMTFHGSSYTRFARSVCLVQPVPYSKPQTAGYRIYGFMSEPGSIERFVMEREIDHSPVKMPVLKNPFEGDIKLAIAALAAMAANPMTKKQVKTLNKQIDTEVRRIASRRYHRTRGAR